MAQHGVPEEVRVYYTKACDSHAFTSPDLAAQHGVPEEVRVYYTKARGSHVFTSPDLAAFVVGHPDLRKAFEMVPEMVSSLVSSIYHREGTYESDTSFTAFKHKISQSPAEASDPIVMTVKAVHV